MKKQPFNVMSKAALAGLIGVAGISPAVVASAQEEVQLDLDSVVVQTSNGELVELERTLYNGLADENHAFLNESSFSHVKSTDGTYYERSVFNGAQNELGDDATVTEVLEFLDNLDEDLSVDIAPAKGSINEDGDVVWEEAVLTVESVSAIDQTVDVNGELKFLVNGNQEVTAADLNERGYEVEFKANAKVFKNGEDGPSTTSSTGQLAASSEIEEFQYEVEVIKDGETIASENRGTVTVENQSNIVTEISDIKVLVGNNEITSGKLAEEETAKIEVLGKTKNMDEDAEPTEINHLVDFSVSPVALATIDNKGDNKVILKPEEGRKGDVTVTIEADGLEPQTITLNVGNASRQADPDNSTIDTTSKELAIGQQTTITVDLKDQYGDVLVLDNVESLQAKNADEEKAVIDPEIVKEVDDVPGRYKITLTAVNEAATGDVVVTVDDVELATINVTVKEPGELETYELQANKTEFDLKTDSAGDSIKLTLKGYDAEGLEVTDQPKLDGKNYKLTFADENQESFEFVKNSNDDNDEISNDEIKLTNSAQAGDSVTVVAEKIEGALTTPVAEIELTVIDSTPVITSVNFKSYPTIEEDIEEFYLNKVLDVQAVNPQGESVEVDFKFADDEIQIVEPIQDGDDVVLGTVVLTGDETVNVNISGESESIAISLIAAGEEDQEGVLNVAVFDKDGLFKGDTNIATFVEGTPE